MRAYPGRSIYCATAESYHLVGQKNRWFVFADYSWICRACGGRHCSECQYISDGETVTVYDCGRFMKKEVKDD